MSALVCISTEQQITNYLVFIHYQADTIYCLESSLSISKNWAQGLREVLHSRPGKKLVSVPFKDQIEMSHYVSAFKEALGDLMQREEDIIWAVGGGLKPHSIALTLLYTQRKADKRKDTLAYADGDPPKILHWDHPPEYPSYKGLKLVEMALLRNCRLLSGTADRLEILANPAKKTTLHAFLTMDDYSERGNYFPELSWQVRLAEIDLSQANMAAVLDIVTVPPGNPQVLQHVVDAFVEAGRNAQLPISKSAFKDRPDLQKELATRLKQAGFRIAMPKRADRKYLTGEDFEQLCQARMLPWLKNKLDSGDILDWEFNGKLTGLSGRNLGQDAEMDILVLLANGVLINIDCKYAGKIAGIRSQTFSSQQLGGLKAKHFILYPWISHDLPPLNIHEDRRAESVRKIMGSGIGDDGIIGMDRKIHSTLPAEGKGIRFGDRDEEFFKELDQKILGKE